MIRPLAHSAHVHPRGGDQSALPAQRRRHASGMVEEPSHDVLNQTPDLDLLAARAVVDAVAGSDTAFQLFHQPRTSSPTARSTWDNHTAERETTRSSSTPSTKKCQASVN